MNFELVSKYEPKGDQPKAINTIVNNFKNGSKYETLMGVTGSGKTFTMANIINKLNKPTLVIAHNKTLAAQLYNEFKEFFPNNAVEYFVSYYDYFQPEAYIPQSDTYIEKDSSINDEIDKLRHSATCALSERNDVIIVSSVSCIYGLGAPIDYKEMTLSVRPGMHIKMEDAIKKLISIQYNRNDYEFSRGKFRIRGDVIDVYPVGNNDVAIRIEFFGDEIDRISEFNALTGDLIGKRTHVSIFPASHYVTSEEKLKRAIVNIKNELRERLDVLIKENKLVEAQRLEQRTNYDLEMMSEMGFCSGIENYSMYLDGRDFGMKPNTLMDYFNDDFLIIVDESHVTIPQIGAMYNGDKARKTTLVEYGFRLPSALENRPLKFNEFENNIHRILFVSATPGNYEKDHSTHLTEQIIRPTGLLDPSIQIKPSKGQIDDLIVQIKKVCPKKQKVLVTTLTKKMAEDLTSYLANNGIRVQYLHSDITTLKRLEIIRSLRMDEFDVLIGINLLREGLDIPEVSLVAILDADKEGFLRSETSLIQTIGRAARNSDGKVIMYADTVTKSMEFAINETNRRRRIQEKYNNDHKIIPKTIEKKVYDIIKATDTDNLNDVKIEKDPESMSSKELKALLNKYEQLMHQAADNLMFEDAANYRDKIKELKTFYNGG